MFFKLTSLIFIVFTSVYSVSQNKCEYSITSVMGYNFGMGMWRGRLERLSRDSDHIEEISSRVDQISVRLSEITEKYEAQLEPQRSKAQSDIDSISTAELENLNKGLENLNKLYEKVISVREFIKSYSSVINEFLSQFRDLLSIMNKLEKRDNITLDRMGKLSFLNWSDRQNIRALGSQQLSLYNENVDQMKTIFRNIQELKSKLRSMRRELERVERFVNQLE